MKFRLTLLFLFLFAAGAPVRAQLPVCTGTSTDLLYWIDGGSIYNYNTSLPPSGTNPVLNTAPSAPGFAIALAVSTNLNSAAPATTFYTTVNGIYWYYNGATWVNTGHSAGGTAVYNIGAGGGYIFGMEDNTWNIYRYDGTGNAVLITTLVGFGGAGPYDLAVDCSGNFYVFRTAQPTPFLRKYSPAGVLLQTYNVVGAPNNFAGGGFAIIGNNIYFSQVTGLYSGTISGTTVTVNPVISPTITQPIDFASCAFGGSGGSVVASIDTGYYCGSGPGIGVTVTGTAPFTWSVVSGTASLSATTGSSITITATNTARIRVEGQAGACGSNVDTVTIIVPTATVDAGADDTASGCANPIDTLAGTLTGTTSGVTYNIAWTPIGSIQSGATTLTPVVTPAANTTYTLTVSTPAAQGGCTWTDTTKVIVPITSVQAGFTFTLGLGCTADTAKFINTSTVTGGTAKYEWSFGDGSATDTSTNPVHVYNQQGAYNVRLITTVLNCKDTATATVSFVHPLAAAFIVDEDSICLGTAVQFTATGTAGLGPAVHAWSFGDGNTSLIANPAHTYAAPGRYIVRYILRDAIPCQDTALDTVNVFEAHEPEITLSDSLICEGESVIASTDSFFSTRQITWDMGDGTPLFYGPFTIRHGYDTSGKFTIRLRESFYVCPDDSAQKTIDVFPQPKVNLGPDTFLCLNGAPVLLEDGSAASQSGLRYKWSTGDTGKISIVARNYGLYWLQATSAHGCINRDTQEVRKDCYIDIPNVFTPDGDGLNDNFFPRALLGRSISAFHMQIFNRWGEMIFETRSTDGRGWDGRYNGVMQPQGVFVYLIKVEFQGKTREQYSGSVTLLR